MNRLYVIFLLSLFISSCSSVEYKVSDINHSITYVPAIHGYPCYLILPIQWRSGISSGLQNSYRYSGVEVGYVKVDSIKILDSARDYISDKNDKRCVAGNEVALEISKIKHLYRVAPETGVYYVSAGFEIEALVRCGMSGPKKNIKFSEIGDNIKAGFFVNETDINNALISATTKAAIGVLHRASDECE